MFSRIYFREFIYLKKYVMHSQQPYVARAFATENAIHYIGGMNQTLSARLAEAQALSDADQTRLAEFIGDFIDSTKSADQFAADMQNRSYRAYVEAALDEGEADRQAGRVKPLADALDPMMDAFKAKYGL